MHIIAVEALNRLTQNILEAAGTPSDLADAVRESLVGANLAGHDSHGVIRLPQYVAAVRAGSVQPAARATIVTEQQATARIDGAWGWGQPAARLGAQTVIRLAANYGVGAATIDRCNHIGRVGEYVEMIARAGMIGVALCNTGAAVASYGGRERLLGTNPIAIATPRPDGQAPLLLDFATSGVAEGKLRVAQSKGEQVAPGLILDREGHPSQSPADFYAGGALLPLGLHKGYCLSVMVELLGGALSGMAPSALPQFSNGNGTLMIALNIPSFVPLAQFTDQAAELSARLQSSTTAQGFAEVLMPGDPETRARARRAVEGIPLPEQTWDELQTLAAELQVSV